MAEAQRRVVITDFISGAVNAERDALQGAAEVVALDKHHEAELVGSIEDVDAIMLYHNLALSRDTIEKLTRCKLIVRCGVGFDNVDHAFARQCGIPVANIPDYGTEEVADSAIGMMLSLTRGIHYLNSRLRDRQGPWMYTQVTPLQRLRGRVLGIVGLGRIGIATALRGRALGMDVLFYDPYKQDGYDKTIGVRRAESLEQLMRESYVVSMHAPLTDETRHMINATTIELMQRGSYLVNTARGGVVDTTIIPDAIASGRLAGAGIDVLVGEPPADDQPLIAAWRDPSHPAYHRVIVNPHSAFYCEQGLMEMRVKGADACRRAILGLPLRNVIN
jgi:D-3-phosphoglycerate dehydrogenase/C-terminal binding protein